MRHSEEQAGGQRAAAGTALQKHKEERPVNDNFSKQGTRLGSAGTSIVQYAVCDPVGKASDMMEIWNGQARTAVQ